METSGFALVFMDAMASVPGETITTEHIRHAAFRALGREEEKPYYKERDSGSRTLRVMSYNVHGCVGRDGKLSMSRIARIIAYHNPDIICLQELDSKESYNQADIIAQKLTMSYHYHTAMKLRIKKDRRGNAVLTRFPMRPINIGSLPRLYNTPLLEPRGAVWVEIDVNGQLIQVINTHFSLFTAEGLKQADALLGPDWLGNEACKGPTILCGDFNAKGESQICTRLGRKLKNVQMDLDGHRAIRTFPSIYPLRIVDHIFVGNGIKTKKIEVPRTHFEKLGSDHLPLIVEIELPQIKNN
jgi:endonuclease/exonuclease/phosphatase family metal-dependent hydrolase